MQESFEIASILTDQPSNNFKLRLFVCQNLRLVWSICSKRPLVEESDEK